MKLINNRFAIFPMTCSLCNQEFLFESYHNWKIYRKDYTHFHMITCKDCSTIYYKNMLDLITEYKIMDV